MFQSSLIFVKIYALKGWALNHVEKPKGLKLGWGNFQKLSWYQSSVKDSEFLNIQKLRLEEKKS